MKLSKSEFARDQVVIHGYIMNQSSMHLNLDMIMVIQHTLCPTNVTEISCLLGCAGYYRLFILSVADMSVCSLLATSSKTKFSKMAGMKKELSLLKEPLTSSGVLFTCFDKPLVIENDDPMFTQLLFYLKRRDIK